MYFITGGLSVGCLGKSEAVPCLVEILFFSLQETRSFEKPPKAKRAASGHGGKKNRAALKEAMSRAGGKPLYLITLDPDFVQSHFGPYFKHRVDKHLQESHADMSIIGVIWEDLHLVPDEGQPRPKAPFSEAHQAAWCSPNPARALALRKINDLSMEEGVDPILRCLSILDSVVLSEVTDDAETYKRIFETTKLLLQLKSRVGRFIIARFWRQLMRKTLDTRFLQELAVFTRSEDWEESENEEKVRKLLEHLARCEITLFALHGKSIHESEESPPLSAWDELESHIESLQSSWTHDSDACDLVLYFLVQVVLTRLRCTGTLRKDWNPERYFKILQERPALQLACVDMIRIFRMHSDITGASDRPPETTENRPFLPGVSGQLSFLLGAFESMSVTADLNSFVGYDPEVEYYASIPGAWFERERFLEARCSVRDTLPDIETESPWLQKKKQLDASKPQVLPTMIANSMSRVSDNDPTESEATSEDEVSDDFKHPPYFFS
eukprot:m.160407 g.160407  ORF g.160407 m.160407 type:complete len:497 (-) comp14554_c0_seq5:112-1602(-)